MSFDARIHLGEKRYLPQKDRALCRNPKPSCPKFCMVCYFLQNCG